MTFLVMAALVIGSTSVVFAADKVDDTVKSTLVTTAEGLTDAIVQLKDEEIENYMSSGDDFTTCLLYTSDAADEEESGDLGGRRIIKKKKNENNGLKQTGHTDTKKK